MADLPKHKPNVRPVVEEFLHSHPEIAEADSLRERVEALREGVRQTAMHFHISHTQSAFLTVPKFSDCPHPVCEAARKLLEHKEGE